MIATPSVHADMHATIAPMVAIQVRDVPESVRDDLARAARERGQSLQVFLREVLDTEARKSRNREFLRSMTPIPAAGDVSPDTIAGLIREGRDERDARIMGALGDP